MKKEIKNILFFVSEFPPQPGGIGNHALNLATELNKEGYIITVLTDNRSLNGFEESVFDKTLEFKVIRIKRYSVSIKTYLKRLFLLIKNLQRNELIIASGKFPLWIVGLTSFFSSKKRIVIIHGSEVNFKGWKSYLTNVCLKKFEEVIAVSNYTKNLVTNLELENVTVIQNGFNINILNNNLTFSKFNFYPNLITLGNVSYRKGQHNVIEAIPKLKENFPNIHYHIVGIPTEKNVLISRIKDLQIEENVTFYGKVSETEKNVLLLKSDVFIMLSDKTPEGDVEGFGIAIVEANSLGKPSIGSINTGIEDAILNHKSGILVNPKNIEEVNKSVKEIIDFYDEYSRQAQLWSQNFSWKKIIKRYIKVIQK